MTINHHRAGQLLSAYLDGELAAPDVAAVQEHLMDCARCREAFERLRVTKGLLGQLPVAEPPAEFWLALREPRARRAGSGARGRRPWVGPRLAWACAAVLVVLALAAVPLVKGTIDRLHATEIGVDLYVRQHALQMSSEPFEDRAYLGLVAGDGDLVLVGEGTPAGASVK